MTDYRLDDDVRAFVDQCLAAFDEESAQQDAEEQRRRYRELCQAFDRPRPPGITTENRLVAENRKDNGPENGTSDGAENGTGGGAESATDTPVRLFRPSQDTPHGCLIYFHGGGWVVGDLDSHDSITAEIAHHAGITVIAVDYRLAPEHPYPVAHEDCWQVLEAVCGDPDGFGVDGSRIAVGGDSAGAHIAAGLAQRARDRKGPGIIGQILIYGAFGGAETLPSYSDCADAPLLSTSDIHSYHDLYWPDGILPGDAMARPLIAETLKDLPPAFIQAAEYDPLRDDSVEYARRLEAAGGAVELHVESGLIHSFLRARHTTARGRAAFRRMCRATRRLMNG